MDNRMENPTECPSSGQFRRAESPATLTMMTFNIGLLNVHILNMVTLFSNPPYSTERMPYIKVALQSNPVDILALQECYDEEHFEILREALKKVYPHNARVDSGDMIRFHNGLVLFSRHPIKKFKLMPFDRVSSLEHYMGSKSSLIVDVEVPVLGTVTFINMHTTSGGALDPHHPDSDADREDEFRQVSEVVAESTREGKLSIILGDLNCGPDLSIGNFSYILGKGFRDTFLEAQQRDKATADFGYTWEPDNELNMTGPHSHTPPQRMDHVLLPAKGMEDWQVEKAAILFQEKVVNVEQRLKVTLSDHYGLLVKIVLKT